MGWDGILLRSLVHLEHLAVLTTLTEWWLLNSAQLRSLSSKTFLFADLADNTYHADPTDSAYNVDHAQNAELG